MDWGLGVEGESKSCAKTISRKCAVSYPSHFHFHPGCDSSAEDRRTKAQVYSVCGSKVFKTQG